VTGFSGVYKIVENQNIDNVVCFSDDHENIENQNVENQKVDRSECRKFCFRI
jgi:hypothetical protein